MGVWCICTPFSEHYGFELWSLLGNPPIVTPKWWDCERGVGIFEGHSVLWQSTCAGRYGIPDGHTGRAHLYNDAGSVHTCSYCTQGEVSKGKQTVNRSVKDMMNCMPDSHMRDPQHNCDLIVSFIFLPMANAGRHSWPSWMSNWLLRKCWYTNTSYSVHRVVLQDY